MLFEQDSIPEKEHLIVFDIDGTLTDSVKPHQSSFTQALYQMGVPELTRNFSAFRHHTDSFIAKEIYESEMKNDFTPELLSEFENHLMKNIQAFPIPEIKGAGKLIHHLHQNTPFALCFATGSLLKPALYKLETIGVASPELVLVASNEIHSREDIVTKAIHNAHRYYQVERFKRIISVGDGLWDLKTANHLNLKFIGIGSANKELMLQSGMRHHFDTLDNFEVFRL